MNIIRTKKTALSLDLAPLIDVVFQLLIFFMLTSSFSNPAIKLILPKAVQTDAATQEKVVISINQQGELFLNDQLVKKEFLKSELQAAFLNQPNKSLHIKGDQEMPYRYFVEIMDIAKQAGAQQINVVHQKNETP